MTTPLAMCYTLFAMSPMEAIWGRRSKDESDTKERDESPSEEETTSDILLQMLVGCLTWVVILLLSVFVLAWLKS